MNYELSEKELKIAIELANIIHAVDEGQRVDPLEKELFYLETHRNSRILHTAVEINNKRYMRR